MTSKRSEYYWATTRLLTPDERAECRDWCCRQFGKWPESRRCWIFQAVGESDNFWRLRAQLINLDDFTNMLMTWG